MICRMPVARVASRLLFRLACLLALPFILAQCQSGNLPFGGTDAPPPAKSAEATPPVESAAPPQQARPVEPLPGPGPIQVQPVPGLTPPGQFGPAPVRIGLLLPLSGPAEARAIGEAMLDAATMALFDFGAQHLQLLPRDTGGTPEGARAAAEAVLQEGATLILGPVFAASVEAAAEVAKARKVPVIAFSSDRRVASEGVFLLSFTPQQEVSEVVDYALETGLTRFAALVPQSPYGEAVLSALQRSLEGRAASLVRVEYFPPDGADAHEAVKRLANYGARHAALVQRRRQLAGEGTDTARRELAALKNFDTLGDVGFDAVLLPAGGAALRNVAPLLPYYDIDKSAVRILGTGRWDAPGIGQEPALIGGWYAGTDRKGAAEFRKRFEDRFARPPLRIASLAYDSVALVALLAAGPSGPDFSLDNLTDPAGFAGVDGIFRFERNGQAVRGLAILQVERDGFRLVRPAPSGFRLLTE